jgi:TM2 domain-containing membrane protein YozV
MTPIRTSDPATIEHRLLELAYTTDAKITAPVLAYFAPCSIEDAERVLDNLTARDRIQMEIEDDGTVVYVVPDRQKLQPRVEPQRALEVVRPHSPLALRGQHDASPTLAAILSLVVPGAGQLYTGRWVAALLWFLVVSAGYALILPGLVMHVLCVVSAASSAHRLNSTLARLQLQSGMSTCRDTLRLAWRAADRTLRLASSTQFAPATVCPRVRRSRCRSCAVSRCAA